MTNKKAASLLLCNVIIINLFISCVTNTAVLAPAEPYPGMEIYRYPQNRFVYSFPNDEYDTLIIVLEGGGWHSALGVMQDNFWKVTGITSMLLPELRGVYAFLVPEKLKRQPGPDYYEDMEDRANYTAENLVAGYTESINKFLADHDFSSIVLIGFSEGALLLPFVYEKMDGKDKVTAMVSMGFGGLSMYESYGILSSTRSFYPPDWIEFFADVLATFNPEKSDYPDSYEEDYFGLTYRYHKSFMHIRPFDYYKNIDIPILFIHGDDDDVIPWESTFYLQENLPEKPFTYKYFPWEHYPEAEADILQFRKEIAQWVLTHS